VLCVDVINGRRVIGSNQVGRPTHGNIPENVIWHTNIQARHWMKLVIHDLIL
jgi:hypothetical protein